jgi:branched-chain amino acid transport system ATP-binding protein
MTAILEIAGLVKRFGGLVAADRVTLSVEPGEIHALIGPNGAGKTTVINLVCGELSPDAGTIRLAGRDITRASVPGRVALGLGRTFQVTSLLDDMTVRENIGMAAAAREGGTFRLWDRLAGRRTVWAATEALLAGTPLEARAGVVARDLSHGEKKQLELLVALARRPAVLLLDEPMAGLGAAESQEMIARLAELGRTTPMLLVEHDMDAVFALATRISVMVYGRIIAQGCPAAVRADPKVREAYLGAEDGHA